VTARDELLVDLARLLRKYGPSAFSDLADWLKDPEARSDVISVLDIMVSSSPGTAHMPRQAGARRRDAGLASVRRLIDGLADEDPQMAELLATFVDMLASKQALASVAALQQFARDNGLPPIKAKSRDAAITALVRALMAYDVDAVRSILQTMPPPHGRGGDRTLEGWTDVILGRDDRSAPR
jgi:hypothetical protein